MLSTQPHRWYDLLLLLLLVHHLSISNLTRMRCTLIYIHPLELLVHLLIVISLRYLSTKLCIWVLHREEVSSLWVEIAFGTFSKLGLLSVLVLRLKNLRLWLKNLLSDRWGALGLLLELELLKLISRRHLLLSGKTLSLIRSIILLLITSSSTVRSFLQLLLVAHLLLSLVLTEHPSQCWVQLLLLLNH